jgi:hypothetical protein
MCIIYTAKYLKKYIRNIYLAIKHKFSFLATVTGLPTLSLASGDVQTSETFEWTFGLAMAISVLQMSENRMKLYEEWQA